MGSGGATTSVRTRLSVGDRINLSFVIAAALPLLLDKVYTLADVVKVDYQIPGCPPSGDTLCNTLEALLAGKPVELAYEQLRYD